MGLLLNVETCVGQFTYVTSFNGTQFTFIELNLKLI